MIDLETKKTIQTFTDNPQPNGKTDAVQIEFTKDGKSLIAARINGDVVRIDYASGKESLLARFSRAPGTFALSPDEKHLTVWGDKQSIRMIDAMTGKDVAIVPRGGTMNRGASGVGLFHPDGKLLAAIEQGWGIGYFDAKTGKRLPYSSSDRTEIGSIAFTADGKWLISSHAYFNEPGKLVVKKKELLTVKIWDPNTGKLVRTFSDHRFLSLRLVPGPGNIGVDFRHSGLIRIVQFVERE